MNEEQRQVLADAIDTLERESARYEKDIEDLMGLLNRKQTKLAALKAKLDGLKKGVDW